MATFGLEDVNPIYVTVNVNKKPSIYLYKKIPLDRLERVSTDHSMHSASHKSSVLLILLHSLPGHIDKT